MSSLLDESPEPVDVDSSLALLDPSLPVELAPEPPDVLDEPSEVLLEAPEPPDGPVVVLLEVEEPDAPVPVEFAVLVVPVGALERELEAVLLGVEVTVCEALDEGDDV